MLVTTASNPALIDRYGAYTYTRISLGYLLREGIECLVIDITGVLIMNTGLNIAHLGILSPAGLSLVTATYNIHICM
jgi:hypothetical protein